MLPGGSGNPFIGLNTIEKQVLQEVTAMGVPLRAWDNPDYLLGLQDNEGLLGFIDTVKNLDPEYANDFWTKMGYLGTEQSELGDFIRQQRIQQDINVKRVELSPAKIFLDSIPRKGFSTDYKYFLLDHNLNILGDIKGKFDKENMVFIPDQETPETILKNLSMVKTFRVDNSWPIAVTTYHRHHAPTNYTFEVWDQFKNDKGRFIYPQRSVNVSSIIASGASGNGKFTGNYKGKMIVISNMLDVDAYPWHGDWYAKQVKASLGEKKYRQNFRLWFNDHADHHDGSVIISGNSDSKNVRLVSYVGILEQAVKDVSSWVENNRVPASTTGYAVKNGQVEYVKENTQRNGIQPNVSLSVGGQKSIQLSAGQKVTLEGVITLPEKAKFITVEWSQMGQDDFVKGDFTRISPYQIKVKQPFVYHQSGVFFPVLRVTTQRDGAKLDYSKQVSNLDRVRLIVKTKD